MTTDNGLQLRTIDDVERVARISTASGICRVTKPEEAAVILLTGRELGLSPMQSLRGIYVVNKAPVLSADLLVAVVRRSGLCGSWRVVESTTETCTITTLRVGETEHASRTWTMADARRAQLTGKPIWSQYPAQMLRHRCAADLAREVYPDVVLGLYTPEEMDSVEREPTRREAAPIAEAAPQLPPPAPKPSALDDYRAALSAAGCLHDAAQDYRILSQRLHAEDATTAASEALAEWLDAGGYVLTATEQRAAERGDYPREMLDLLDALAECATGDDVVRWYPSKVPAIDALGAHAAATKAITAKTYCAREKIATRTPNKVFAAALAPRPPTGTDSPSSARGDTATGDATPAEAPASAEAQASIARVGDPLAYLAGKRTFTEVERAVVAHGAHVPALAAAAVARLEALGEGGDDGNRARLVAAWVSESASRAQRAERTAAKVQRAA